MKIKIIVEAEAMINCFRNLKPKHTQIIKSTSNPKKIVDFFLYSLFIEMNYVQ